MAEDFDAPWAATLRNKPVDPKLVQRVAAELARVRRRRRLGVAAVVGMAATGVLLPWQRPPAERQVAVVPPPIPIPTPPPLEAPRFAGDHFVVARPSKLPKVRFYEVVPVLPAEEPLAQGVSR